VFSGFSTAKTSVKRTASEVKVIDNCLKVPEAKTDLVSSPAILNVKPTGFLTQKIVIDDEALDSFQFQEKSNQEPASPKRRIAHKSKCVERTSLTKEHEAFSGKNIESQKVDAVLSKASPSPPKSKKQLLKEEQLLFRPPQERLFDVANDDSQLDGEVQWQSENPVSFRI
jgi:hypothetical protein